MTNGKYDCYLVKNQDGELLKFSYDSQQGIYYQVLINANWSDKKSIYKESLEYFHVVQKSNGLIHIFCQDICGNLILCTLEGEKLTYKTLLHMKNDAIMPIYIRAFFSINDIHLLYNIIDKYTYSEVLVHQVGRNGVKWSLPQIITKLDYSYRLPYDVWQDSKNNIVLFSAVIEDKYQLISMSFYSAEGKWGKEEIVYTSLMPYIDFTFYLQGNKKHYLFIVQDDEINKVVYKNNDGRLKEGSILFQHESIDSCLLIMFNERLWALWICGNKLYGCVSIDYGKSFSKPRIYRQFGEVLPVKVFYQENSITNQLYVMNLEGEEFFLKELLQEPIADGCKNNTSCGAYDLKMKLKIAEEEIMKLNGVLEHEKNQILKLQYELYKKKEQVKLYLNDNDRLKGKNTYLEEKLLSKDKEIQSLRCQIDFIHNQYICNSEKPMKKTENDNFKQGRFSFVKWLFDNEN